jgi:xanthine dehydrogenase accessory factor
VKAAVLAALREARASKTPAVLLTTLEGGAQELLIAPEGDGAKADAARRALRRDQAFTTEIDGADVFVEPFNPPLRLVIVGAVHIAQPLAKMAQLAGFEVIVVDPRTRFASEARFPGVDRRTGWPDEELEALALDARSAVVTLTHDPKLDDPGLQAALKSPAFYIGALGSRKTHSSRIGRLEEAGFDAAAWERIHGPVGLNIGARSPAEIAVAVLAQVIGALRVTSA